LFIAQPPLYKAKHGKSERYLKDEHALEAYLMERAVENRRVRLANGLMVEGARLIKLLERMVGFGRLLKLAERRGAPEPLVLLLLRGEVRTSEAFSDKERLLEVIRPLREQGADVALEKDEEHGVFDIVLLPGATATPGRCGWGGVRLLPGVPRPVFGLRGPARSRAPAAHGARRRRHRVSTREALVQHFLREGRRGLAIQRYKAWAR